jgi:hypothetical protein
VIALSWDHHGYDVSDSGPIFVLVKPTFGADSGK